MDLLEAGEIGSIAAVAGALGVVARHLYSRLWALEKLYTSAVGEKEYERGRNEAIAQQRDAYAREISAVREELAAARIELAECGRVRVQLEARVTALEQAQAA